MLLFDIRLLFFLLVVYPINRILFNAASFIGDILIENIKGAYLIEFILSTVTLGFGINGEQNAAIAGLLRIDFTYVNFYHLGDSHVKLLNLYGCSGNIINKVRLAL